MEDEVVVTTKVASSGIVDDTKECDVHGKYSQSITAMLFIDQLTKNTNIAGTRSDASRLRLTMVRTEDAWKAADTKAL